MTASFAVGELTTYSVSDDGKYITLRLTDSLGAEVSLRFDVPSIGMLGITLPTLIEAALRRQYQDRSFRYTHAVCDWAVEQSTDIGQLIITLRTKDGFGASFTLPRTTTREIGKALADADVVPKNGPLH